MSLKDKLLKVTRREEPATNPASPLDYNSAPQGPPLVLPQGPYAALPQQPLPQTPYPAPTTPPTQPGTNPEEDADKTIFEPDLAATEQLRQMTAGWNQNPSPTAPAPPAAPAAVTREEPKSGNESPSRIPTPAPAPVYSSRGEGRGVMPNDYLPLRADGTVDFPAVYARAGIRLPAFGAEQVRQMLDELPAEMPTEMRKQTIQVMINTMGRHLGSTPEVIARDARDKSMALDSFVKEYEQKLKETTAGVEAEIASLLALIEEKRRTLQGTDERLAQVKEQCRQEADGLTTVSHYLTVSVPPVAAPVGSGSETLTGPWESTPSVERPLGTAPLSTTQNKAEDEADEEDEEDTRDTLER